MQIEIRPVDEKKARRSNIIATLVMLPLSIILFFAGLISGLLDLNK